jgi:hypothetical protein
MNIRSHFNVNIVGEDDTVLVGTHSALDLVGEYNNGFTINGTGIDTVNMRYRGADTLVCGINLNLRQTYTDLQYDSLVAAGRRCPEAGSISVNALLNLNCIDYTPPTDTTNLHSLWNIGFVFHNGEVTTTYRHGLYNWITTTFCGNNPPGKERWAIMMSGLPQLRD